MLLSETQIWKFHVFVCQTTSKHCTKKRAARAARLFFFIQPIKSLDLWCCCWRLFTIYQKVSEISVGMYMVRLFWCSRPEYFGIFRKIFGTSWKVVQNSQPEFPNRKYVNHLRFSPFPSPTTILMRITCHLVRVVQMVHANSDGSFSFGLFAYQLYKPSTNQFSHVNGKQPTLPLPSSNFKLPVVVLQGTARTCSQVRAARVACFTWQIKFLICSVVVTIPFLSSKLKLPVFKSRRQDFTSKRPIF